MGNFWVKSFTFNFKIIEDDAVLWLSSSLSVFYNKGKLKETRRKVNFGATLDSVWVLKVISSFWQHQGLFMTYESKIKS